jgi:vancomycin resistance protein YoaR
MTKVTGNNKHKKKQLAHVGALAVAVTSFSVALIFIVTAGRVYPHVYIENIPVGGLSLLDTQTAITNATFADNFEALAIKINVNGEEKDYRIPLSEIKAVYDVQQTALAAYQYGKDEGVLFQISTTISLLKDKKILPFVVSYDDTLLDEKVNAIADQISDPEITPSIAIQGQEVTVTDGQKGIQVDRDKLKSQLVLALTHHDFSKIEISTQEVDSRLTPTALQLFKERGQALIGKTLTISFDGETIKRSSQDLAILITPTGINPTTLKSFVKDIATSINRPVTNPVFSFENGKVVEFKAPEAGLAVKEEELAKEIERGVQTLLVTEQKEMTVAASVTETHPTGNMSDVNSFGITQQIGVGNSTYKGSIPGRIHNVALAASKISGTLLAPNETFSFNKVVGDISQKTGFQQAYVISGGKTILGDGGGVCQVSTTLFRAAMNAGLPIVERRAHSYRVGYYEQDAGPGMDATVFSPTTDFKFTNDTGHYILIQAVVDSKKTTLQFHIYGTSDGRVAEVTKPVLTDQIAPPDDLYVDDPTLKVGQTKQIEHKAWGGRSSFNYTVTRNGETIYQKKFVSVYQPWQAVYMRGTQI